MCAMTNTDNSTWLMHLNIVGITEDITLFFQLLCHSVRKFCGCNEEYHRGLHKH